MEIFNYDDVPVLETTGGKLKGYFYKGEYIFKGVPYAYADRFRMPEKNDVGRSERRDFLRVRMSAHGAGYAQRGTYGPPSLLAPG